MNPLRSISQLYGWIIDIRNRRFDQGRSVSVRFHIPVICIGNITVGGTGKTPHTEYLIRMLQDEFHVACLSRGYKRKTKGFVLADANSSVESIGDEPLQMFRKFPKIKVAVQENRREGICRLLELFPQTDLILLDDAFQHRAVTPSLSIMMMDFSRPVYNDCMLPYGRLREKAAGKKRADIVIVSKCPADLGEDKQAEIRQALALDDWQTLYFTTLRYDGWQSCTGNQPFEGGRPVLGFCGIGSPKSFLGQLQEIDAQAQMLTFSDHHSYNRQDAQRIAQAFAAIKDQGGVILTTEKDYYHIVHNEFFISLLPYIYYSKIEVAFLGGQEEVFNKQIRDHVRTYPTKRPVPSPTDRHTSENRYYTRVGAGQAGRQH